ncbi:MAG: mannosyltransferase family protein, partial [Thermomicrobiales bacterium]
YMLVATGGYDPNLEATAAFWPLYPWLMDIGSRATGWAPETIGYLISNVAFYFALHYLYRLVTLDFDSSVAQRSLWALALFPTAFFFNAVYTESLFLLLAVAALYHGRKGEWLVAGVIGLLAALTRSAGVMLLAPFGILFLQQYGWSIRRWFPNVFASALPALGPIIFGWMLTRRDLGFFDWANQQWQWNRFSATPWRTFDCTLNGCDAEVRFISGETGETYVQPIDWGWIGQLFDNLNWTFVTSSEFRFRFGESHVLELSVTVLAIVLVLVGLRLVPLYYTAFAIPALIVPLLTPSSVNPLMSMPRFVLPLFPLFVVAALLIRHRTTGLVLAAGSSILLVILTMQFALWYWVS